jgi:hypothetical protein
MLTNKKPMLEAFESRLDLQQLLLGPLPRLDVPVYPERLLQRMTNISIKNLPVMYTGKEHLVPSIEHVRSMVETLMRILGFIHILWKAEWFSLKVTSSSAPLE